MISCGSSSCAGAARHSAAGGAAELLVAEVARASAERDDGPQVGDLAGAAQLVDRARGSGPRRRSRSPRAAQEVGQLARPQAPVERHHDRRGRREIPTSISKYSSRLELSTATRSHGLDPEPDQAVGDPPRAVAQLAVGAAAALEDDRRALGVEPAALHQIGEAEGVPARHARRRFNSLALENPQTPPLSTSPGNAFLGGLRRN